MAGDQITSSAWVSAAQRKNGSGACEKNENQTLVFFAFEAKSGYHRYQ